ncbi:hypothetical protein JZ751_022811 [Albula glossodonta]|uniref:Uncharacterized protein n=1 Tax=Albula glossodonta TaxID=121402 RepID=A0A8T2PHA9_9TELE|nr:hypothetical protein JZ751_022811 [Albula glossodonta]
MVNALVETSDTPMGICGQTLNSWNSIYHWPLCQLHLQVVTCEIAPGSSTDHEEGTKCLRWMYLRRRDP